MLGRCGPGTPSHFWGFQGMFNTVRLRILVISLLLLAVSVQYAAAQNPSCPPGRLILGEAGKVSANHSVSLRATPSTRGRLITVLSSGDSFIVVAGPTCADGYQWW